jgi:hypothetical protein
MQKQGSAICGKRSNGNSAALRDELGVPFCKKDLTIFKTILIIKKLLILLLLWAGIA